MLTVRIIVVISAGGAALPAGTDSRCLLIDLRCILTPVLLMGEYWNSAPHAPFPHACFVMLLTELCTCTV